MELKFLVVGIRYRVQGTADAADWRLPLPTAAATAYCDCQLTITAEGE